MADDPSTETLTPDLATQAQAVQESYTQYGTARPTIERVRQFVANYLEQTQVSLPPVSTEQAALTQDIESYFGFQDPVLHPLIQQQIEDIAAGKQAGSTNPTRPASPRAPTRSRCSGASSRSRPPTSPSRAPVWASRSGGSTRTARSSSGRWGPGGITTSIWASARPDRISSARPVSCATTSTPGIRSTGRRDSTTGCRRTAGTGSSRRPGRPSPGGRRTGCGIPTNGRRVTRPITGSAGSRTVSATISRSSTTWTCWPPWRSIIPPGASRSRTTRPTASSAYATTLNGRGRTAMTTSATSWPSRRRRPTGTRPA